MTSRARWLVEERAHEAPERGKHMAAVVQFPLLLGEPFPGEAPVLLSVRAGLGRTLAGNAADADLPQASPVLSGVKRVPTPAAVPWMAGILVIMGRQEACA
jgi:hypothetical protein